MAETRIKAYHGTLSNSNATLYTVPTATKFILKSISLCNKTASAATVTLKLDSIEFLHAVSIAAGDTYPLSSIDQVLDAGELIEGSAGTASAIDCIISGYEVT